MQGVEAVRAVQEVGWRLAGAADTAHLYDLVRWDRKLERHVDDLARYGVVPTPLAERRGRAPVVAFFKSDQVQLITAALRPGCCCYHYRCSCSRIPFATAVAVKGRPSRHANDLMSAARSGACSLTSMCICPSAFNSTTHSRLWALM